MFSRIYEYIEFFLDSILYRSRFFPRSLLSLLDVVVVAAFVHIVRVFFMSLYRPIINILCIVYIQYAYVYIGEAYENGGICGIWYIWFEVRNMYHI